MNEPLLNPTQEHRLPSQENAVGARAGSRRRYVLVAGILLLIVLAAGIFGLVRRNNPPELPEIPTVNLDGADPEIAKVVRIAQGVAEKHPHSAIAWGQYAMVLDANGFSDAAGTCYSSAALLEPKNPLWPYLHGYLDHHAQGGPEAALPRFQIAAGLSPPHSMAQLRLADTLLEMGRLEEAEAEYLKTLAARAKDELAQLGLARLAIARQQYAEALKHLQAISESGGTRQQSCAMKARVYDRLGDRAAAEREREKLTELPDDGLRDDDPVLLVRKLEVGLGVELAHAKKHMEERHPQEMMATLENAVHRYPDSFEAWAALGNACVMIGDTAGAEKAIKRSIQLSPRNSDGWLSLGNMQIWQKRHPEALESIQKAIALDPQNGQAHFSLGECRLEMGDAAGAAHAYREAMRLAPRHPLAKQRLREMQQVP